MLFSTIKVLFKHKRQAIKDLDKVVLPPPFRGVPQLTVGSLNTDQIKQIAAICPTGAIGVSPFSLDMGQCLFCGDCARKAPNNIVFTQNFKMATTSRAALVVYADRQWEQQSKPREGLSLFARAIKLRQVCAGGDGSCEMELDAAGNVNFDMRRYGIDFVASPRHADGIVLTGPITSKMAAPLLETYNAVPSPKVLVAVGTDAISGGLFVSSASIDRSFLDNHTVDLYVPGNPAHPLTFIDGVRHLIARAKPSTLTKEQ